MELLTITLLALFFISTAVLARDSVKRRNKKRDREIMRRFHRYMDSIPPPRSQR